jgi:hypothetical protein
MPKLSVGWWSSVGCNSFRDETYGDIVTSGNTVRVHIVWRQNVKGRTIQGRIVPVPTVRRLIGGGRYPSAATVFSSSNPSLRIS